MIYVIIIYYAFKAKINSCYFDKSSLQNRCKITAIISHMQIFFLLYCIKVRVGIIIFVENQYIRYFSMPKKVRKKYSF